MFSDDARELLREVPLGTRVVVRYLLPSGSATDALGDLSARDEQTGTILTRRGPVPVLFSTVVAARVVPSPPPARRVRG